MKSPRGDRSPGNVEEDDERYISMCGRVPLERSVFNVPRKMNESEEHAIMALFRGRCENNWSRTYWICWNCGLAPCERGNDVNTGTYICDCQWEQEHSYQLLLRNWVVVEIVSHDAETDRSH